MRKQLSVEGLPLFDWSSRRGSVLPFPLSRQYTRVHAVAVGLHERQGEAASLFWRGIVRQVKSELAPFGLDEEGVWSEVWTFHQAVQAELRRIARWDHLGPTAA